MITGDNADTAREVGRQIGLWQPGDDEHRQHMTGPAFSGLSDADALAAVSDIKILSRARPMDKMRMVKLLQQKGGRGRHGGWHERCPRAELCDVGLAMGARERPSPRRPATSFCWTTRSRAS